MKEKIEEIKKQSIKEIENCTTQKELNELKVKYLGKKGELTTVLRGMGALAPEERPIIGSLVNQVRDKLNELFTEKEENFKIFEVVIELQIYINQSEENLLSPKGIELRVNRSIQVEGTFGIIKQDMPFDRFTRTSLDKVSTEFMMVCLGLNIRKLFKFYDAKSKNKFWIAPNDLQPETKKKPSAKRLSNKVNRKKLKKEADEPNPKG